MKISFIFTGFVAFGETLSKDDQEKFNRFLLTHAETGDYNWMKIVIKQGAQVHAIDPNTNENILHKAARGIDDSSLQYALSVLSHSQIKKFINALNSDKQTPLQCALSYKSGIYQDRVEILLKAGADPSVIRNKRSYGPLLKNILRKAQNKTNGEKAALKKTVFLAGGAVAVATAGLVFFGRQRAKTF
jgi:hypothetical protein